MISGLGALSSEEHWGTACKCNPGSNSCIAAPDRSRAPTPLPYSCALQRDPVTEKYPMYLVDGSSTAGMS